MRARAVVVGSLVAVLIGAGGSRAFAGPINLLDSRPAAYVGANLAELQDVLGAAHGCNGCIDAINNHEFRSGAHVDNVSFGVWSGTRASNVIALGLFKKTLRPIRLPSPLAPVPEPGSMLLLGTALLGLGGLMRRRRGKVAPTQ